MSSPAGDPVDKPAPPADQYKAAIDQLRTTAQWLMTALAAVGALLLTGVGLTGLGSLEGDRLLAAVVSATAGILGVALAVYGASRVLTTQSASPGTLLTDGSASRLRDLVDRDPTLLRHQADSLAELIARYKALPALPPGQAHLTAADLRATVGRLTRLGVYLRIREVFTQALVLIFVGALICAAGVVAFAYFANPPDDEKKKPAPTIFAPSKAVLTLTDDGEQLLRTALGAECSRRPLPAVIVGGSAVSPEVVTLPSATCTPQRFVLTRDLGLAVGSR